MSDMQDGIKFIHWSNAAIPLEMHEAASIKRYGYAWYRHFCLWPVKLNDGWVWLRYIERLNIPLGYYQRRIGGHP